MRAPQAFGHLSLRSLLAIYLCCHEAQGGTAFADCLTGFIETGDGIIGRTCEALCFWCH